MKDLLQEIRRKLYLARDGASSDSMRKKGVDYKINFGVTIPRLKPIAAAYAPNRELSDALWATDTRELRILATMIQDPAGFEQADEWVRTIRNSELAEQAVVNLFVRLPNADRLALDWLQSSELFVCLSGFLLLSRLFVRKQALTDRDVMPFLQASLEALTSESLLLQNAALNSMRHFGLHFPDQRTTVFAAIDRAPTLTKELKESLQEDLAFDFDYYT